jgi:probable HAF family extracellular repeat protein
MSMHAAWSPTTPWYALAYKDTTAEWVDLTTAMPSTSPFERLEIGRAINANRQVVGGGILKPDGSGNWVRHAFKSDLETGKTIDLGTIPGYTGTASEYVANAINAKGHVVGAIYGGGTSTRWYEQAPSRAFIWTQEWGIRDLNSFIDPSLGVTLSVAFGINDNDEIVGMMKRPGYGYRLYRMKINVGGPEFFEPTVGMDCTVPSSINASGQVSGYSDACDSFPWFWWQAMHPWVSENGAARRLPMPSGVVSMAAWAVSDSGYVVGDGRTAANAFLVALYRPLALDQPEVLTSPQAGTVLSALTVTNVAGNALPLIAMAAGSGSGPNLWQWGTYQVMPAGQSGQLTTFPQPSGFTGEGGPYAMNRNGDLAGWYTLTDGPRNAMVWTPEGGLRDLNLLIDETSGWFLRAAVGMNDARVIVGFGTHNSLHRAFRLDLTTQEVVDLGTLETPYQGLSYSAAAINVHGHIVGTAGYDWDSVGFHLYGQRAFIYTNESRMTDLNDLVQVPPGWVLGTADAINDNDEVTGVAFNASQNVWRAYKFKLPSLPAITQVACLGQTDGTPCNDGSVCTTGETCQAGLCTGGSAVTCTALDACHSVGTCDPGTGVCSNPPISGTVCLTGTSVLTCAQGSTLSTCVDRLVTRTALSNRLLVPAAINDMQTIAAYPGLPAAIAAHAQARINPSGHWNNILVELSMLGTMKHAAGTQVLKDIVHMTVPTTGTCMRLEAAGCLVREAQYVIGLQLKAIDGLAFLHTAEGDAEVLAAVANGANPKLQARAVLAYLANHGATSANKAMLAGMLPANRQFLVDRFIKDSNMSAAAFGQALTDFYNNHPEQSP